MLHHSNNVVLVAVFLAIGKEFEQTILAQKGMAEVSQPGQGCLELIGLEFFKIGLFSGHTVGLCNFVGLAVEEGPLAEIELIAVGSQLSMISSDFESR